MKNPTVETAGVQYGFIFRNHSEHVTQELVVRAGFEPASCKSVGISGLMPALQLPP